MAAPGLGNTGSVLVDPVTKAREPLENNTSWGRQCLNFTSAYQDYVRVPSSANIDSFPFTIYAEFDWKEDAGTTQVVIATDNWTTTYRGARLAVTSSGAANVQYGDGTGGGSSDRNSIFSVDPIPSRCSVVAVCRGRNDWDLFVNGAPVAYTTSGTATNVAATGAKGWLGRGGRTNFDLVGNIYAAGVWGKELSADEAALLNIDPLAPFRQRRYAPVSLPTEEPPTETASTGLIRLKSPRQSEPSYKAGYAKSAAESANPELWDGLKGAWMPSLGSVGGILRDAAGHGNDGASSRSAFNGTAAGVKKYGVQAVTYDYFGVGTSDLSNDYLVIDGGINPKRLTVSVLARLNSSSNDAGADARWSIAGEYDNTTNRRQWQLAPFSTGDNIIKLVLSSTGANFGVYDFETDMQQGVWYHIVATYDGNSVRGWVNGKEEAISLNSGNAITGDLYESSVDMRIGSIVQQSSDNGVWRGDIGDLCVWDRALDPVEVQELFRDSAAPFRQRRYAPVSLQTEEPLTLLEKIRSVAKPTTTRAISLKKNSVPSYKAGYARSASESAHPELWEGLVGAWMPSLGVTGDALFDVAGTSNGELAGGASWLMTDHGWAVDLQDGGHIRIDDPPNPSHLTAFVDFTFDALSDTYGVLIDQPYTSHVDPYYTYHMRVATASKAFAAAVVGGWGSDDVFPDYTTVAGRQTWCLTFDEETLRMFVNGLQLDELSNPGSLSYSGTSLYVGKFGNLTSGDLDGKIHGVCLYDRALSPQEIQTLHRDPLAPFRKKTTIGYQPSKELRGLFRT